MVPIFAWSLVVKNLPARAGDVRDVCLIAGWEDLLEEGMATHSSILAWRIPWTEDWWATVHTVAKNWTQLKQLSISTGKTIALSILTFIGKAISLLFNMLSRFVIVFLLGNKRLLRVNRIVNMMGFTPIIQFNSVAQSGATLCDPHGLPAQ